MLGRRPKTLAMQSVSQVPGFPGPMRHYGVLCKCIELAATCVAFDSGVKAISIKRLKPGTKPCQFPRRQLLDRLFNVFGCCHSNNIPLRKRGEKPDRPVALDAVRPARSQAAARR
jgi:hypothetical protein